MTSFGNISKRHLSTGLPLSNYPLPFSSFCDLNQTLRKYLTSDFYPFAFSLNYLNKSLKLFALVYFKTDLAIFTYYEVISFAAIQT